MLKAKKWKPIGKLLARFLLSISILFFISIRENMFVSKPLQKVVCELREREVA